jgi:NMD protein affecting ribosome stability and mRNA decay
MCGRGFAGNRWGNYKNMEHYVEKTVGKIDLQIKHESNKKLVFNTEKGLLTIKIEKCNLCQKQHSQYFEGVLQLRYTDKLRKRIEERVKKQEVEWIEKHVYITKRGKHKDGEDLFLTNKKDLGVFADKLGRIFGAKVNKNAQLFSRNKQTSKNIYRLNVLVTFPDFEEGDVVFVNEKVAKVMQLRRQIKALDLRTGKTFGFFLKNEPKNLEKTKVMISKTIPEVTILNPETYEDEPIANPKLIPEKLKKHVYIVQYEGKNFIVP